MDTCLAAKSPRFVLARKERHAHRRRHYQRVKSVPPVGFPSHSYAIMPGLVRQPHSSPGYPPPRSATQQRLAMDGGESPGLRETTNWCVSSGWSTSEDSPSYFGDSSRFYDTAQWSDQMMLSPPFSDVSTPITPSPRPNSSGYDSDELITRNRFIDWASEYPAPQPLSLPDNHTLSAEFQRQIREAMDELNRQVTYHGDLFVERMRQLETTRPAVDIGSASPRLTGVICNGEDDEGTLVDGDDDSLDLLTQSLERDFTVKDYSLVTDHPFVL
ncbi:hypothetical protein IWQ61_003056 [Dispira simplex]|nr:hypothetical protein IWQ61_003056 [Dispira simplex]